MRLILFFDLPTLTKKDLTNYRHFIRDIKKMGFYMLQESVYIKMVIDSQGAISSINKVKALHLESGNVMVLTITENQFASIDIIVGECKTDVVNSADRFIEL